MKKIYKEHRMSNKKEFLRAVKFTLFSISAGLIQIVTFALLNEFANLPFWPCYLIALLLSVVWNFTLNRKYTFHSANNIPIAMLKTLAFYAIFTPLSTLLEYYLADIIGYNEYLITALNMVLNFILEYLYQRFYVFKDAIETNQ